MTRYLNLITGIDVYAVGIESPSTFASNPLSQTQMEEDLLNITGGHKDRVFETDDFDKLKKQVLDSVLNAVRCE